MSRIRTIKPSFWRHEDLSELPEATHLLAASLLNYADDEGYFKANPKLVRAECCPLREPSVSIEDSLTQLSRIGYLRLGKGADGKRYDHIIKFQVHQRINRPTASEIECIDIVWEGSCNPHPQISELAPQAEQGKAGEPKKAALQSAPTVSLKNSATNTEGAEDNDDIPASLDRRLYPEAFEALWREYQPIAAKNATKGNAFEAWGTLSAADKDACRMGLVRYVERLLEDGDKQGEAQRLASFIDERGWEKFAEEEARGRVPTRLLDRHGRVP